jgi:hypothetical protein
MIFRLRHVAAQAFSGDALGMERPGGGFASFRIAPADHDDAAKLAECICRR